MAKEQYVPHSGLWVLAMRPLWTIQMLMQVVRWLKNTPIILVGDGGFACGKLAWRCLKLKICLISRLKMNARLYDIPRAESLKKRGRRKIKGTKLYSFREMIDLPDLDWKEVVIEITGTEGGGIRPECSWIRVLIEHLAAA